MKPKKIGRMNISSTPGTTYPRDACLESIYTKSMLVGGVEGKKIDRISLCKNAVKSLIEDNGGYYKGGMGAGRHLHREQIFPFCILEL